MRRWGGWNSSIWPAIRRTRILGSSSRRRISGATRGVVLTVSAVALAALAFFVRDQSESIKFRSELFSVMLVVALVIFVWAAIPARDWHNPS